MNSKGFTYKWDVFVVYCIVSAFLVFTAKPGVDALKFLNNPPQVLSGFLGMNAIINCTTDEANATVKLFYSKNFVTFQERALSPEKLHLNGQVFTLLNLGVIDGGKYRCTATNHQQTINWPSSFGILFVTRGDLPDIELVPSRPIIIMRGQNGQISCKAKGATVSKLQWKKLVTSSREESVPDSKVTNIINKTQNFVEAILTITNAQPQDTSDYKCVLTAFGKQDYKLIRIRVGEALAFRKKPSFLQGNLGQNVEIDCSTNDANATVSLLHQGHPFVAFTERKPEAKKLLKRGQVFTLLYLDQRDVGVYACKASNQEGEIIQWPSWKGVLYLSYVGLPDYFVLKPEKPITVAEGQNTKVTCKSEGILTTKLQWKKLTRSGDAPVPDNLVKTVNDVTTNQVRATFRIRNAQVEDGGVYKCVLSVLGNTVNRVTRISVRNIQTDRVKEFS